MREQEEEFPLKNISYLLECPQSEGFRFDHSDHLRPADIEIYAELGHLSRFCHHNLMSLLNGTTFSFIFLY